MCVAIASQCYLFVCKKARYVCLQFTRIHWNYSCLHISTTGTFIFTCRQRQDKCPAQGYNSTRVSRLAQTDDLLDTAAFIFYKNTTALNVPTKQRQTFPGLLTRWFSSLYYEYNNICYSGPNQIK